MTEGREAGHEGQHPRPLDVPVAVVLPEREPERGVQLDELGVYRSEAQNCGGDEADRVIPAPDGQNHPEGENPRAPPSDM